MSQPDAVRYPIAVLIAMGVAAGILMLRGGRVPALFLAALSILWLPVNGPVEGPTLLPLSQGHGVTLADLLTPLALVVAYRSATPRR